MKGKLDKVKVEKAVYDLLVALGEDPGREGLKNTPKRVAKMYEEILIGNTRDPRKYLEVFYEEENYEEMVIVKDIPLYSICEHHLLPFFGRAHVAYIPRKDRVTGLSKIARVVETFAYRLQLQERLTKDVADTINNSLNPQGVIVVIEAEHFCMTMRGVKKPGSKTVTSAVRGVFLTDSKTRTEALDLIGKS